MDDHWTPQNEIDNLSGQVALLLDRMHKIRAALRQAEGARITAEKILAEKRGGMLRRPTQALLEALDAIEQDIITRDS
jgi:hypothetical protein